MPKLLTRAKAREALGNMPERTFTWYIEKGMPRRKQGRAYKYPWPDILKWYIEQQKGQAAEAAKPQSVGQANLRRATAEAELAELKLAEKRKEVMRVEEAARWVGEAFERVRAQMLTLEVKAAPELVGMKSAAEARPIIHEHVLAIMDELRAGEDVLEEVAE